MMSGSASIHLPLRAIWRHAADTPPEPERGFPQPQHAPTHAWETQTLPEDAADSAADLRQDSAASEGR